MLCSQLSGTEDDNRAPQNSSLAQVTLTEHAIPLGKNLQNFFPTVSFFLQRVEASFS